MFFVEINDCVSFRSRVKSKGSIGILVLVEWASRALSQYKNGVIKGSCVYIAVSIIVIVITNHG